MAISKSAKIQAEIEKVTAKINEQQARLKELEQKKLEAENSEIVEIVRGMSVSLTDLPVLLQTIKNGGPGYETTTLDYMIYTKAFSNSRYGEACALAMVLLVIILLITKAQMTAANKLGEWEG